MTTRHLSSLKLFLKQPDGLSLADGQVNSWGPFLQGVLMDRIDSSYAGWLHAQPINPYSQYCSFDKDFQSTVWKISALTDEACEQIVEPMRRVEGFEVKGLGITLSVDSRTEESIDLKELADLVRSKSSPKLGIGFVSPTAFKSAGRYVIVPNARLVFQSLLMKYCQVYEGNKEVDQDTLDYLDSSMFFTSYRLKSQYFDHAALKGKKIPGFKGEVFMNVQGPEPLVGLVHMLAKFGEFSGVGIKTSMGMGGIRCL